MKSSIDALLAEIARTPTEIDRLLNDVPIENRRTRPSADEFSAVENVCHLRDIEIDGYTSRIKRILSESKPKLADLDGARLAIERDYNSQSVEEALRAFQLAREQNVALLKTLDEATMSRAGILEGVGEVTLTGLLSMMNEHDEGHLDEFRRLARLAKSKSADV